MYRPHPHLVPDPGPRYAVKRHRTVRTSPVTYGDIGDVRSSRSGSEIRRGQSGVSHMV
jgi:hypothetical protein